MMRYTSVNVGVVYFLIFSGIGGLFPLLSLYLADEAQLSGTQIGVIMSVGPIMMMVAQPLWGMVCDITRRPRAVLILALFIISFAGFLYIFVEQYIFFIIIALLVALFQSAIVPVSDSITLNYAHKKKIDYGNFRLWGALGFAFAAYVMGELSERFGLSVIFYGFAAVMLLAAVFAFGMPRESAPIRVELRKGIHQLMHLPKFILFLMVTFLVFGPIHANNAYFGLLFQDLGATVAGVGLAFLFAAGTEAPFMKLTGPWIRKYGFLTVALLAAVVSGLRWILYYFEPSIPVVYISTLAQGFSVGLFIPASLQYVRDITPDHVQATAIGLYAAVNNGLGNWFCTFVGGMLIDAFDIFSTYLFLGVMTFLGVAVLIAIMRMEYVEGRQVRGNV
jgi:PPP family 3-phenylpropionic acid transporter